jgi:hypothetical protein
MVRSNHPGRSVVIGILMLSVTYFSAPAPAQEPQVKSWPKHGVWQTQLVKPSNGGYICMLNALGNDPHSFGMSFIETPTHLAFMVDDRKPGLRYLPTMTVLVDGQQVATYPTFNDPPMTSTAPNLSAEVKALMARLTEGKTITVESRRTTYTLTLDGFSHAAEQFGACRQEMARLQRETVGKGD